MASIVFKSLGVYDHHGDLVGDSLLVEDGVVRGFSEPGYASERRVDGYILPAFVDAHLHVVSLGLSLAGADLRGSRSPAEVAERLSRARGPLAYGRGWDQEAFEGGGLPDRRTLDSRVGDRPAIAVRVCGHMAVANTMALSIARPWERFPGLVDRERGVLLEDAVGYTLERLLEGADLEYYASMALRELEASGIAGASSMSCSLGEARAIASASERYRVRVSCYSTPGDYGSSAGISTPRFSVVGVKMFSDGSLGARTARLRRDYSDDPGNRGLRLLEPGDIVRVASRVLEGGGRVAVHAIGDEALDVVLEAYSELQPGPRARVEHASVAWDGQIRGLASLGVWVVVQPRFRVSDWWLDKRLGERASLAYRFQDMWRAGVRLAISSDSPVEPYSPGETLSSSLGLCDCRYGQDLSPMQALEAYTVNAAEASGGPVASIGRIERGAVAALNYSPVEPLKPEGLLGARKLYYH